MGVSGGGVCDGGRGGVWGWKIREGSMGDSDKTTMDTQEHSSQGQDCDLP